MNKGLEVLEELKALKGLEALEVLKQNNIDDTHMFDYILFDIIKKELKENEYLKTELLGQHQELNIKNKVLKIIKKRIDIKVRESKNKDVHILVIQNIICVPISQEEFDLLKEVIL